MSSIATTNETSNQNNVTSLPSTPKPQTSKEVIAANVQLLIKQLEAGHSEGLTAYLTAMGRFHNYSFGNILEIARQKAERWRLATTPIRVRRTGDALVDFPASPTASPSTAKLMDSFHLCGCGVTPASSTRWRKPSCKRSRSSTKHASRSDKHDACRLLFLPKGDRGCPLSRSNVSAPPASTTTAPPPQTSPSVLPRLQTAWRRPESNVPLKTTISLATLVLRNMPPISGEP
jgi:hypothetical protein